MLAFEQQPGDLAEGDPEREAGGRQDRRPVQHAAESLRQLAIGDGVGRGPVVDAPRALVPEDPLEHPEQVVEVNP